MLGTYYLHQNEIVHRDLKPENILIFEKAPNFLQFKICDFGISKDFKSQITNKTVKHVYTPMYAAPEKIKNEETQSDSRFTLDSWPLGIIFYHLITDKEHPYKPDEPKEEEEDEKKE